MSKTKINLKLIIALFGVALVMCLLPLGIQAIADPGEGEPAAPSNENKVIIATDTQGELFTLGDKYEFTLQENESIQEDIVDHVGYLYIKHADETQTCIAAAFSHDQGFKKFSSWLISGTDTNMTYTAKYETYDPESEGYYIAGHFYDAETNEQIEGVEATWVNINDWSYITSYTNNFGFVCLKIPYGVEGSIHVVRNGYVSDYSIPQIFTSEMNPTYMLVKMIKGVYCSVNSNIASSQFHVREYISNGSVVPKFDFKAEDVRLNEVPTRMLPVGSNMIMLSNEFCDKFGFQHGSLYYYYKGNLPLGANIYEIIFEPDNYYNVDGWSVLNSKGSTQMVFDKEYPINDGEGPYVYTVSLSEKATEIAQTGDDNLPIVIALIVLVCACGVFIAYKKIRKK